MSGDMANKYSPGDVITSCEPISHVVFHQFKSQYCDRCLAKSASLKKCAKCHHMFYCDRNCQKSDWKAAHKHECDVFAKHYQQISDSIDECPYRAILTRLVIMTNSDQSVATNTYTTYNGQQRCLNDLLFDDNEVKSEQTIECVTPLFVLFNSLNIDTNLNALSTLYVQIVTNHFGLMCSGMSPNTVGIGIYIPMSVFKHSCQPNAAFINSGKTIQIRAMKRIEPNEEITIAYIDIEMPKNERQSLLKQIRCLGCDCVKCVSNTDQQFDYAKLKELGATYIDIVMNPEKQPSVRVYEYFTLESMLKLGKQMIDLRKQLYGYYNPNLSSNMFLHSIHLIEAMNKRVCDQTKQSIKPFISETIDHLRVTHGIDHYFYKILNDSVVRNNI